MRLQTVAGGWCGLLLSTLLCTGAVAKKDKPSVKSTKFDFFPLNVEYFDDSDVILFQDEATRSVWRSDNAGEEWHKVESVPSGVVVGVSMHPFDPKRAYVLTDGTSHWKTSDRGESWQEFSTQAFASPSRFPLSFHAGDPDRIIFNAMDCPGLICDEISVYTTDGFSSDVKLLRTGTAGCHWAKSSELFETGQQDLDKDRVVCVSQGRFSGSPKDYRLLISDNYFRDGQEFEPELEPGRTVQGILNLAVVKKYLVIAATAEKTDELALYISDDTIKWHRAVFPHDHKLEESAYTVLEGTNYSIQIDVLNSRPSNPMGVMLSSNSNGTYFTRKIEHTNRDFDGFVDFEKVTGIQGIFLLNTVKNFKEVEESGSKKEITTEITFDDGRTFQSLKCDGEDLHLHSVTELSNSGRVFSSPAPGLVMGIGNTGDHLKSYKHGNLYVSDDAGVTWRQGLKGPHKYEFGDSGSILVAVEDSSDLVDEVKYSLNHGKDWDSIKLEQKVKPAQLTTTKDSTSLKFLLEAVGGDGANGPTAGYLIALDFEDMHERKCEDNDDDMENWSARVDKDGKPTCLMGHTQTYRRRKADADCFVKSEFKDPVPTSVPCPCTDADFECDFNFVRSDDGNDCVAAPVPPIIPEGSCKAFGPDDTFMASSGWRQIPGDDCKRSDGEKYKDAPVEKKCSEAAKPPSSGKISHTQHPFGDSIISRFYLERTGVSTGDDETVVLQSRRGIFLSHDHGKTWDEKLAGEKILGIITHPYFNDVVYFLTKTKKVFYSIDRGENIRSFEAPHPPTHDKVQPMYFHPKHKDWIIWVGAKDCDSSEGCHNVVSLTTDRGDGSWYTLQRYAEKCEFINVSAPNIKEDAESKERREKLIYCVVNEVEDNKGGPKQLVSSDDFFVTGRDVHFTNIQNFATMSEFLVVARNDEENRGSMKAAASIDGKTFADAKFPHGFIVDHQEGYTVLESSTHSIFLHVTVNNEKGLEYGSIIKSNSNGTSYALSLNAVDRDTTGYVDFEKMFGIEGLIMVNVVANYESKDYASEKKKLKSMMSHNDGAEWAYLSPPPKDLDGKKFDCSGDLEKCSLNIHGYTDRSDKSHTFYSTSALGMMIGVGNVGQYLTPLDEADTFLSADAGVTWKHAKKGRYMWEFGDQGSILVLVKEEAATRVIHYSLDEGDTWLDYEFSDHDVNIFDITTVPSDNSRNFLLWGLDDGKDIAINLDFTGIRDTQCVLDEKDAEGGDYELWTPRHPNQDNDCLFGHVSQYHRKKKDAECYNGRMIPHLHDIAKNCTCTRLDYECDYNFERQVDGSCKLVQGLVPLDHKAMCAADPDRKEYFEVTGYRRLPTTTCSGGTQFDESIAHPCDGFEDEFNKKHGMSGAGIFFAIVIPIGIAAGVGYWVWTNFAQKIGQIRLGEQSSSDEPPYVKYPIMVIAGAIAIAQALPLLASSLWRSASSALSRGGSRRFTTRDSFARGRGDYAIVDEDEGELLGDESDEEV